MGRRGFVDAIWIRSRMNTTDARAQATARLKADRAAFHELLADPTTSARLDAMLADNRRLDAAAAVVVDVEIVPVRTNCPGPVIEVVLEPKKAGAR